MIGYILENIAGVRADHRIQVRESICMSDVLALHVLVTRSRPLNRIAIWCIPEESEIVLPWPMPWYCESSR